MTKNKSLDPANGFISFSGISKPDDVREILEFGKDIPEPLVFGLQMSTKSLNQGIYNHRQPDEGQIQEILSILSESEQGIPSFHLFSKKREMVRYTIHQINERFELEKYEKEILLQLNVANPYISCYRTGQHLNFINIIKPPLLKGESYSVWNWEDISNDIDTIESYMNDVTEWGNIMLIDGSHGRGIGIDLSTNSLEMKLVRMATKMNFLPVLSGGIMNDIPAINIVQTMQDVGIERYGMDAETGLFENDNFSMKRVKSYISQYEKKYM